MCMMRNHAVHWLAFLIVVIRGTTFVSTKVLIQAGLNPGDIFFARFLIAYLCILPFSCKRLWAGNLRDEALLLAAGITGGSLYFLTENVALQYSYCSNVSLLVCSTPMLTSLLLGLFYRDERVNLKQFLFSLAALAGMALVVLNGHFVLKLSLCGDLLALAAAVTWALYSLCMRMLGGRYPMLFVTRKIFFYGLLTILPLFLWHPLQTSPQVYMAACRVGQSDISGSSGLVPVLFRLERGVRAARCGAFHQLHLPEPGSDTRCLPSGIR